MEVKTAQLGQPKPNSHKKMIILSLTILLVLIFFGWGGLYLYTRDNGLILDGVKIGNVNVSNLTQDEAEQKLAESITPILDQKVEFKIQSSSETLEFTLRDLGLTYKLEQGIQQAYEMGHNGTIVQKAIQKYHSKKGTAVLLPLDYEWNSDQLQNTLQTAFAPYNKPVSDATFSITPDNKMVIQKETFGQEVNLDEVIAQVESLDPLKPSSINVTLKVLDQPKVTAAQLEGMKITGLLGRYSTWFDANNKERTENVRISTQSLDGVILMPGEEFSFNNTVGERTSSAGYKEALIIVNDEFVPGLGGGVCQVSSTLYNAAVASRLQITERHAHSLEITYVPPGQDATVAYPYLDFKFKNNTPGLVLIRSSIKGSTLTFDLYGHV
ncbi:VanW family protein [Desulfitobacterium sp.]|uniref:VanW family protein n=1 Tax=Desulfitobacterium sp. TaxID=49981 RepID=UPI002B1EAB90|nr:VanW family protein [Desulfitobacterium sp.]MEA4901141.1 VanW family protein [Desulfitobacterium sp.]